MPHIVIHLSGASQPALASQASATVSEITQRILGKKANVIAVTVQFIPADQWFIGGRSLSEQKRSAFHLDISITDETNTKAEKAEYVQRIHEAFARLRPDLHEISYVHLIDARAAAYGYGGRTQEYRHQHA